MKTSNLDPELRQIIGRELHPGETLQFSARARPGAVVLASLPMFLFAIPFTGFAVFWMVMAGIGTMNVEQDMGPFRFFPLFGLPFLLVGLFMLSAPLRAFLGAGRTLYAITDQRALTLRTGRSTRVISYYPRDIGNPTRTEKADGSGNLMFAEEWRRGKRGRYAVSVGFRGVPDVREAERALLRLLERAAREPAA